MKILGYLGKGFAIVACFYLVFLTIMFGFTISSFGDVVKFLFLCVFSIGLFIGICGSIIQQFSEKKYCKEHNIEYQQYAPGVFIGSNLNILCKTKDSFAEIYNYMASKTQGFDYVLANYKFHKSYTDSTLIGKKPSISVFDNTFCVLFNPNIQIPEFYISPRKIVNKLEDELIQKNIEIEFVNGFDSLQKNYKYDDIDLSEINKSFSEKFIIASNDENAVKEFFNDKICQIFVDFEVSSCFFEGNRHELLFLVQEILELKKKIKFLEKCANLFNNIK